MDWWSVQRLSGGRRWVVVELVPERFQATSLLMSLWPVHGLNGLRVAPVVPWWGVS